MKKPKKITCKAKGCTTRFWPANSFHIACSPRCAAFIAIAKKEAKEARAIRDEKKQTRLQREALLTLAKRQQRARIAAQKYARLRDMKWFADRGEQPKCIMCGRENANVWHGCHFMSVGSKGGPRSLHPANINLGCNQCNFFAAQNDTQYRENMIRKYGEEMVVYLETAPLDYSITAEEVDEIWKHYKNLCKEIPNE